MRGYVYVLTNSALPDLVKIGFSTKDPSLRVSELSNTSVPAPFTLLYEVLVEDPYSLEQAIHKELKSINAHEGKEFFRISPEKAIHTVRCLIEATSREIYFEPKTSIKCPKCNAWSLSQICGRRSLDSSRSCVDQYSIKVLDTK